MRTLLTAALLLTCALPARAKEALPPDPAETFAYVLAVVQENYARRVSQPELIYAAAESMLDGLDPHSAFLRPRWLQRMREDTSGEFGGLGLVVTKLNDGPVVVHEPIPDTPAERAGLQKGDEILAVDGESTIPMCLDCPNGAIDRMKGRRGTAVTLSVRRDGWPEPRDFRLVRDRIRMKSVKGRTLEPGYGYVEIAAFTEHTDHYLQAKIEELRKLNDGKLEGLVLDLRGNPGGLLDQAVRVAELFLPGGKIVSTIGRGGRGAERHFARARGTLPYMPLVLLVDAGSASAAEIVAGALQDHGRALLMGERTFGKGSVQSIIELDDGSGLKLTVARYYTPNDRSIQERGIDPDVVVRLPLDWVPPESADPETAGDYLLWSALNTLKTGNRIRSTTRPERNAAPDG